MAAKLKENCYKVPGQEPEAPVVVEQPKKVSKHSKGRFDGR